MELSRLTAKVTFGSQVRASDEQRLICVRPLQLFSVSMYCMWVYDYFLTLEDEVRHPAFL